jgi:hypothetical protein
MPLFSRTDPDLRSLIGYLVARAEDRGISLHRTKLVKLLYLIDVERVRGGRAPLTGLEWTFSHHGPHAPEVAEALQAMLDTGLAMPTWKESRLRRGAPAAPDGEEWPASTKSTVDRVMDAFAALSVNELLDHVYFHTGPMRSAVRGAPLDMEAARGGTPARRGAPLVAPARPEDVAVRLERWRARTARRLAPVALDPPGAFLDPGAEHAGEGVRGRLRVPA